MPQAFLVVILSLALEQIVFKFDEDCGPRFTLSLWLLIL